MLGGFLWRLKMTKKRLVLPKKVKIGCFDYKVVFPFKFDGCNSDCLGLCKNVETTIYISNNNIAKQKVVVVFLHEIIHAIDSVYFHSIFSEKIIERLAETIYLLVLDNNIRFIDDKYIPKKIRIGGLFYNVIHPSDFQGFEDGTNSLGKHDKLTIHINRSRNNGDRYIKSTFIYQIIHALINVYEIDDMSDDGTFAGDSIYLLSNVIYQIFLDNNLEKVIKDSVS